MLSQISNWVLSIAGIVCVSVIIELIMPEGQINRYIKGILSFVVVLVILMPLPKLLNSKIDYDYLFDYGQNIEADQDYLYQLNLDKINSLKEEIEGDIEKHGYKNVSVYISADIFESQMKFKVINVDISKIVITQNSEHNDILKIKKDITNIILNYIKIDEEAILYDE